MNKPLVRPLDDACAKLASIDALLTGTVKNIQEWFQADGRARSDELGVIEMQAYNLRNSFAAFSQRATQLSDPSYGRRLAMQDFHFITTVPEAKSIVEVDEAYDQEKLNALSIRDIRDAIEFDTEFKYTFGLARIDDEISGPLTDALELLLSMLEDGNVTVPGMVVQCLKSLLKGHRRAFGRYFARAEDPFPRPSVVVQAEIDERMPTAMAWLRYELKEAREKEAAATESTNDALASDGLSSMQSTKAEGSADKFANMGFPVRALQGGDIDQSRYDDRGRRLDVDESYFNYPEMQKQGYLPIEADEALCERIEADLTIDPLHLESLDDLKLLLTSPTEKGRIFNGSLDDTALVILDLLLEVAIREIEGRCSTVVGVANKLILGALDIRVAERRNTLDRLVL